MEVDSRAVFDVKKMTEGGFDVMEAGSDISM